MKQNYHNIANSLAANKNCNIATNISKGTPLPPTIKK